MGDEPIINGNGKRQYINLKDPQHLNMMISGSTFIMIVVAIFWFADMKNEWKNHKQNDQRRWEMSWTLPEMIHWANADTKINKVDHADPYESSERMKEMKSRN